MSNELETKVGEVRASVDTLRTESAGALDRISVDVAELLRRIQAGTVPSPEVMALLDSVKGDVDAVSASLKGTDPLPDFPATS